MAERRPDLAREHRLHDRFRGPPRASPVRFQVSRPADRTSRGWARGVPLAECRFPGPATRRLGQRESERSTQNGRAKTLWWWWWWWWWWQQLRITSGRLPRIWGSIRKPQLLSPSVGCVGDTLRRRPMPRCRVPFRRRSHRTRPRPRTEDGGGGEAPSFYIAACYSRRRNGLLRAAPVSAQGIMARPVTAARAAWTAARKYVLSERTHIWHGDQHLGADGTRKRAVLGEGDATGARQVDKVAAVDGVAPRASGRC